MGRAAVSEVAEKSTQTISDHTVDLTVSDNGLRVFATSAAIALDTSMFLSSP